MTEAQGRKLYWPLWGKALRILQEGTEGTEEARKVRVLAKQVAAGRNGGGGGGRGRGGILPDDLRHGAHVLALERDKSSKELNNREFDRVITLFRMLGSPDDIDAVMAWQNPEIGERKRLEYVIKNAAPHGYIDAVCKGKFGGIYQSPFWEDLPVWALRQLCVTLKSRQKSRGFNAKAQRRRDAVEEPF